MYTDVLPPKPDPQSGDPRPPHAPGSKPDTYEYTPHRPGKDPHPPAGEGPILECHYGTNKDDLVVVGIIAVILVVGITLITGLAWVQYWWNYAIFAGIVGGLYWSSHRDYLAAGAEWLQSRRNWVRTYELTKVKYLSTPGGFHVRLTDAHDRTVACSIHELHGNPALWDLVYNGICHSTATRDVQTNWILRRHLPLPTFTDKRS